MAVLISLFLVKLEGKMSINRPNNICNVQYRFKTIFVRLIYPQNNDNMRMYCDRQFPASNVNDNLPFLTAMHVARPISTLV
jgi:hypothetical protein